MRAIASPILVVKSPMNVASRASVRALWGLASWLVPLLIAFVLIPQLLHLLGPERFGILMVALVTPAVASQIDLGLASSAVRRFAADLSKGPIDGRRTLAAYSIAFTGLALMFGTAVYFNASWLADVLGFSALLGADVARELTRWCGLWGAIGLATTLPSLLARAAQSFAWLTLAQTLATLVLWVGAVVLIRTQHPLQDIVVLGILVSIMSAVIMIFAARRLVDWSSPPSLQTPYLNREVRFATGMFAAQIASAVVYQGDRLLISSFGSPAIAGAYALCANLANKPLAAVVAITSFVFPQASELHAAGNRDELTALLHALDRAVALVIIPLLLPALLLAGPFLMLWLGAYGSAELAVAFRVLVVAFALSAFAVPVGHVLAASGNSLPAARFSWLSASVLTLGIAVLVPSYGLLGAVIAVFAAMSTSLLFSVVARRTLALGQPVRRLRFWGSVFVGLATQALLLLLATRYVVSWPTLVLVGTITWLAFFLARALVRALSPEELRILHRLQGRIQLATGEHGR